MTARANVVPLRSRAHMETPQPPVNGASDNEMTPAQYLGGLVKRIAETRDRSAFRELYTSHAPKIKAYAIKQGMIEFADELVQEVMINIWRRAGQFDPSKANASTWIFAIARNARIDFLRKRGRMSAEVQVETDYLWDLPGGDEPVEEHNRNKAADAVRDSLRILPTEQRDVIAKVYLEDKSHQRVADELDLPLGTVKSRVRLALQKLNAVLQEDLI